MNEQFARKNVKLSMEFDDYMVKHLDILDQIPNKSMVVITCDGDDEFNRDSIALARKSRSRRPRVEVRKTGREWVVRPLQLK